MSDTLRWPYNNVQKELGQYGHVGVNTRQRRIGDLKFRFTGKLLHVQLPAVESSDFGVFP